MVHEEGQVDESMGKFLFKTYDQMKSFLSDKITASLFMNTYLLPFYRQYSTEECQAMVNNVSEFDEELEENTIWLAKRLSGVQENQD